MVDSVEKSMHNDLEKIAWHYYTQYGVRIDTICIAWEGYPAMDKTSFRIKDVTCTTVKSEYP